MLASTTDILGPGVYSPNIDSTKSKNPTFGFSKGQRGITSRDLSPGPGAYNSNHKQLGRDSSRIIMSGRPKTARIEKTPGPGAYDNK